MNKSEATSRTESETAQTGCCGSDAAHDHAAASKAARHDHAGHAAAKTGTTAKPADAQKSGHGSGCCCS